MPFVVIASFIHLMIPVLEKVEGVYLIKKKGPKGYFYYTGDLPLSSLISFVKRTLRENVSHIYIFDVYGMYNGMTDVTPYLTKERKDSTAYYNQEKKHLSDEEIQAFLEKNGLA